jgi:hypothetical protein
MIEFVERWAYEYEYASQASEDGEYEYASQGSEDGE